MFEVPTLRGGGVVLRPWSLADVPAVLAAATDPYIPEVTTVPATGGAVAAQAYVARQWHRARSGQGYSFAICEPDTAVSGLGCEGRDGLGGPGAGADHGSAVVTDLGSTNGTVLQQPGLPSEDLKPGIAVQLIPGAIIDLGDGVTIQVGQA